MNPALIAALISQIGVPEFVNWLHERAQAGQMVMEADITAKLNMDVDTAVAAGMEYLSRPSNVNPPVS